MAHTERIIILVDMDCFYCQVEENLDPALSGKPIAVVQYNAWRGGGIIAVNYVARDKGVTRHMRGDEAKEKCPEIELVKVPNVRGKADLTKYREAGKRVAEVLQTFTTLLERASVDEAYLDITEEVNKRLDNRARPHPDELKNSHVVGFETIEAYLEALYDDEYFNDGNLKLAVGGVIAEEIRAAVFKKTGYKCSAGIAHNKILSKLVCGLHKPNQQTILPQEGVAKLYENLPLRKIKSLGGKFGNQISEKLNIKNMGELYNFSEKDLLKYFDDKTANWLYKIARGIDLEPVTIRLVSKSIGCCKKFPGRAALLQEDSVKHWLFELATEISERLEKDLEENNRKAKQMIISFAQEVKKKDVSSSRTHALNSYETNRIASDAFGVIKKHCLKSDGSYNIKFLGISVSKFEEIKTVPNITSFFKNVVSKKPETMTNLADEISSENKDQQSNTTVSNMSEKLTNEKNAIEYEHKDQGETNLYFDTTPRNVKSEMKDEISYEYKDESETNLQSNTDYESDDSISQELSLNLKVEQNVPKSFFQNYLKENVSPVKRNFNTSLILEEEVEEEDKNEEIDKILENEIVLSQTEKIEQPSTSTTNESKETCTECNKKISIDEMASHMDFHFALKIVKNEAELYKPVKNNVVDQIKPVKKGNKRKVESTSKCLKMTSFLVKTFESEDVPTELCAECNKKIRLEDIMDHMDYHMAKKLHLEINKIEKKEVKKSEKKEVKKCDNKLNKKVPSISAFFKPV